MFTNLIRFDHHKPVFIGGQYSSFHRILNFRAASNNPQNQVTVEYVSNLLDFAAHRAFSSGDLFIVRDDSAGNECMLEGIHLE